MSELWRGVSMLFGGSFDPVHLGHLAVANAAQAQCSPRELIWMPAAQAPLKSSVCMHAEMRLQLLQCVLASRPNEDCSKLEIERGGTSYTADTLRQLRAETAGDVWQLLMGWDSFCSLDQWRDATELTSGIQVAVAPRLGGQGESFQRELKRLRATLGHLDAHLLEMPEIVVSSTAVRAAMQRGDRAELAKLLPEMVWQQLVGDAADGL